MMKKYYCNKAFYRDDILQEIHPGTSSNKGDVTFNSANIGCKYSWGYQIWDKGKIVFNSVRGRVGISNPYNAPNVYDNWLTSTNTGYTGFNAPNVIVQYYSN